jgi:Lhr-like helicase
MPVEHFHPLIGQWFKSRYREPMEAQRLGWPQIHSGHGFAVNT